MDSTLVTHQRAFYQALVAGALVVISATAFGATRQIPSGGTTAIAPNVPGSEGLQFPELLRGLEDSEDTAENLRSTAAGRAAELPHTEPRPRRSSRRAQLRHPASSGSRFRALNHRDQRLANGGNQFSVEPPDQALCVGNGYVVEAVNSVLRVFDMNGTPLTGAQALNPFFGYPAAIDRTTGAIGADVIDPICHYDPDNNRFVVAITTLQVAADGSGDFTGKNTIDVAVSNTGNPTLT
jgi:hypothetical protein